MFSTATRFSNLLNRKTVAALFACLLASVLNAHPASAQKFNQEVSPPAQMRPGVRYTTGFTEVRGWEHNLVQGNPNLGHWNWSPIVSYNQSTPKPTSRQSNYAPAPQAMPQQSHYVKPIHAAMPLSEIQTWELNHKASRSTHTDVSARLRTSPRSVSGDVSGRMLTPQPQMLSYGNSGAFGGASGSITRSDVYGTIRSR